MKRLVPGIPLGNILGTVIGSVLILLNGLTEASAEELIPAAVEESPISGDPNQPRRHFRIRRPAHLDHAQANEIYAIARESLAAGYMRSGNSVTKEYLGWARHNTAPYLSSTHGNYYINNYSNEAADIYARHEDAGVFPQGAIIAKDSFSYTESGAIILGPLFIMEKMPKGFNYVSGDWKYTLIQPDGSLFGETNGESSGRVTYCIGCHLTVESQDHLFFVPRTYRVK